MNHQDHRKKRTNAKKIEGMPLCSKYKKGPTKIVRKTQKGYSEELPDDSADFTDSGAPLRQYDQKLMRARSRFEGVRTPRNDWNRRLRTKTSLEQT